MKLSQFRPYPNDIPLHSYYTHMRILMWAWAGNASPMIKMFHSITAYLHVVTEWNKIVAALSHDPHTKSFFQKLVHKMVKYFKNPPT